MTGGDEDWGLNYDEKTKNVRLSKEIERPPREIEAIDVNIGDSLSSGSGSPSKRKESDVHRSPSSKERASSGLAATSSEADIPGEPILMKASADLTPVRGKDGWNKYKPTNLNTEDVEEAEEAVDSGDVEVDREDEIVEEEGDDRRI